MIRITVRRDFRERVCSVRCSGHAAFDIEGGVDIVCAGVSALMGALVLGLKNIVGIDADIEEKDGFMSVYIPSDIDEHRDREAQILLKTTVLALQELSANYKGFIKIIAERC